MPTNKVYFVSLNDEEPAASQAEKTCRLFDATGFGEQLTANDITAIKTHFGEAGNLGFVKPPCLKAIVDKVKAAGGAPFLAETSTLYNGRRKNAIDHILLAREHGFTPESTGAPIIICDGLIGRNELEIKIKGKHYQKVSLAADIISSQALVAVSHMTGHMASGFGAAIKNLGMGCASRKGKMKQHSDIKPTVDQDKCTACGVCVRWCPVDDAIKLGAKAEINHTVCIGCGECLAVCHFDAVQFSWGEANKILQEKMAEHALGVVQNKENKVLFYNYLNHLTKDCDCMETPKEGPILPNVGILASTDPVAIDQASVDLIKSKTGEDLVGKAYPEVECEHQLAHGEKIGLGSRKYELIAI